jgi:hypothetical protein
VAHVPHPWRHETALRARRIDEKFVPLCAVSNVRGTTYHGVMADRAAAPVSPLNGRTIALIALRERRPAAEG